MGPISGLSGAVIISVLPHIGIGTGYDTYCNGTSKLKLHVLTSVIFVNEHENENDYLLVREN